VKNSGYKNLSPPEVKRTFISYIKICQILYQKCCEISVKPKTLPKISATYISVLELFHIKFMFISFSLCCNHLQLWLMEFYMTFYMFDKIKEVGSVFLTFSVCVIKIFWHQNLSKRLLEDSKKYLGLLDTSLKNVQT
jgi:hypothetical protein